MIYVYIKIGFLQNLTFKSEENDQSLTPETEEYGLFNTLFCIGVKFEFY